MPDKTAIERQIAATDKQIDQLVYELQGLAENLGNVPANPEDRHLPTSVRGLNCA